MANHNVTISAFLIDGGSTSYTINVPDSAQFLAAGDTVTFQHVASGPYSIRSFSSSFWTNTSNITTNASKTVKSGNSNGTTSYVYIYDGGTLIGSADFRIQAADTTPNSFGLTNKTNIDPKSLVHVGSFQVTGINTSTTASITGSGSREVYFLVGYKPRKYTSTTVNNGDTISVYAEAEWDYEAMSRTISMTVGTRTETVQVVTRQWPLPEQVINLDISPPADLYLKKHIATFFGGSSQPLLTDYLRGNFLVPSIEQNAHVPKSPPIYISDLYNTASALYFIYKPPDKSDSANTLNGGKNLELVWNVVDDYTVGYGELSRYVDYRYTFTSDDSELTNINGGDPDDVTLHSTTGNPGTWSQSNSPCWLKVSAPQNTERWYKGTLTIYARNAIDTSLVISKTVQWTMFFWGP